MEMLKLKTDIVKQKLKMVVEIKQGKYQMGNKNWELKISNGKYFKA